MENLQTSHIYLNRKKIDSYDRHFRVYLYVGSDPTHRYNQTNDDRSRIGTQTNYTQSLSLTWTHTLTPLSSNFSYIRSYYNTVSLTMCLENVMPFHFTDLFNIFEKEKRHHSRYISLNCSFLFNSPYFSSVSRKSLPQVELVLIRNVIEILAAWVTNKENKTFHQNLICSLHDTI